jgi:hypothetical protein
VTWGLLGIAGLVISGISTWLVWKPQLARATAPN